MSDQGSESVRPTGHGPDGPDPFSREGAAAGPADQPDQPDRPPAEVGGGSSGAGASPAPWTSASWSGGDPASSQDFPLYGQPSAADPVHPVDDPADGPGSQPSAPPQPAPPYPSSPPHQPAAPYQPAPPYQAPWAEQPPAAGYGSAPDPYGPPGGYGGPGQPGVPAAYGDPNAYGGAYGYGYGYGPTDHPAATPALVTGLIGLVLSLFCGFGGLVGIAGIVQGSRAKREIDGDPARWTGRSKAHAGMVTGIIGLVVLGLWMLAYVILGISGG